MCLDEEKKSLFESLNFDLDRSSNIGVNSSFDMKDWILFTVHHKVVERPYRVHLRRDLRGF